MKKLLALLVAAGFLTGVTGCPNTSTTPSTKKDGSTPTKIGTPPKDKDKVEPPKDKDKVEPPKDKDKVEPPKDKDKVEPPKDKDKVEPPKDKPKDKE